MKLRFCSAVVFAAGAVLALAGGAAAQNGSSLVISNVVRTAGATTLAWTKPDTNFAFTVQAADSLADGVWLNVTWSSPWPTLLNGWTDTRAANGNCFYRVLKVPAAQRGALGTITSLGTYTRDTLLTMGAAYGVTPQYGVTVLRLTYETIDPEGGRIQATGLLCLPTGYAGPLRLLSYQHGTIVQKSAAPSSIPTSSEGAVGIMMASLGYAAVVPDYLGLGGSPGFHPYHHAVSEATSAIDLLRATRSYCSAHSVVLTNRLFLMGYSQGGHATMALHRELERYHSAEFTVAASAPMAGAYDLSGTTADDFLSERLMPNPYYFAFMLSAYQNVYHIGNSLSNLLAAPYATTLPPLLDGLHSSSAVNTAMANPPYHILKPEVLASFRSNPRHPLRLALRDNDLYDWTPVAPMRLWHCAGDQDVAYANSVTATNHFQLRGVTVPLMDPDPTADHSDCALPSMLEAKTWFDTIP
jgi:hypothetical protein